MDDELAVPTSHAPAPKSHEQADISSDEEDGAPDWAKFLQKSAKRDRSAPLGIPKRGEKEFEPSTTSGLGEGSNLQSHILSRARDAMFRVLRDAERTSAAKTMSLGVWVPDLSRAYVTVQKGVVWHSIGYSVPRDNKKRLELLPEETLYLIERGNLWCCREDHLHPAPNDIPGPPMSAQQAVAEMIGKEGLTLEKYEVYAYLKRLGYIVTRTKAPDSHYPLPPPFISYVQNTHRTIWHHFVSLFVKPVQVVVAHILSPFQRTRDWWFPLKYAWPSIWNYPTLYDTLRKIPIPKGHQAPLWGSKDRTPLDSPYMDGPFYNVYKPGTPYRKSSPEKRPDFQVTVVDARTTRIPSLYEFDALYGTVDDAPTPVPRKVSMASGKRLPESSSWQNWLASWLPGQTKAQNPARNPFPHLKQGKKVAILAVVDAGNVGFFRFGQGAFEEWPMNFGA